MSNEMTPNELTPEEWVASRSAWLVDVAVVQNGYGGWDVVARVNGSYSDLGEARCCAEDHRREIGGVVARLRQQRGWRADAAPDVPWPFVDECFTGAVIDAIVASAPEMPTIPADDPYAAVDVLSRFRHHLSPDILRSLQSIWFCASAAKYGEPYEDFAFDAEDYAAHDTVECENENADRDSDAA